jgi:Methyltransferase FkbM domain
MDVQGWEASVLEGGQRKLRADRPVILTEISRENLSGFGTMEGLRRLLYDEHTVFRIEGQRESYRLAPLAELPQLDLFEIAVVPNEMITAWDHALSELSGVA